MKTLILMATMLVALMGKADDVYNRFLNLKQQGVAEREQFYQGVTNGMVGIDGQWVENGGGMIFTTAGDGCTITNVEYYVRVYTVSNNLASTNLTCVNQSLRNGEVNRYTYDKQGNVEMIEIEGRNLGDLNIYQIDADGELDAYIATTNFIGIHGVRQYRNGNIIRVGPIPNLEIFRP